MTRTDEDKKGLINTRTDDSEVLWRRAELLSQAPRRDEAGKATLTVLTLFLGEERYGIELAYILEVVPFRSLTPLPRVPLMLRGVTNYRGKVVPVYDLMAILSGKPQEPSPSETLIVLGESEADFALAANKVEPPFEIDISKLKNFGGPGGEGQAFARGVDESGLVVLDAFKLLNDESLVINIGGNL
jgi:purine-binding chemotaxis protein CheW